MSEPRYAHSIYLSRCGDPKCTAVHFDLFDDNNQHFASAAVGVRHIPALIETLQAEAYIITTEKDG